MKKFYVYLFMLMSAIMLSSGACSNNAEDEPEQTEPGIFNNLKKCPVDGVYVGEIVDGSNPDLDGGYDGVWCQIKEAPKGAWSKKAPDVRSYVFFKRSDFEGADLLYGKPISFRILKYEKDTFRFHVILANMPPYNYFNCIVKPM